MKKLCIRNPFKRSTSPPAGAPRRRSRLASIFKSYGFKPARDRLNIDHFTIMYCQNRYEDISRYYLLYKYLHTIIMISFLCLNVSHLDYFEKENLRWHLYLNHWSTLVCFVEAACGVFVVTYFRHHCRTKAMRNAMNISDSAYDRLMFYMYLYATSITFSTTASFLFWAFIFDKDYLTVVKLIEHGSMPVFMVFKLMLERVPFEIPFVLYPTILLGCYFVDVTITYYVVYHKYISSSIEGLYIFKNFNTKRPMYFMWFIIKACLILAAVHVLLVAIYVSKRVVLGLLCRKPRRRRASREGTIGRSTRSYTPRATYFGMWPSTTDQDTIPSPISTSTSPVRRTLDIIGYLETLHRQDFIHPEWRHYSADHPSGFYLTYRFLHMVLFAVVIVFSMLEIDKIQYDKYSVKYIILWIFYFGNFFLVVSLFQSIFGFAVIYGAFRRDVTQLKYYQKSDSYVTGFQKGYSTINSTATTLAIFAFITSWQLVEDTGGSFVVLDYSYDTSHIINPLSMTLDFLVVGHPFKFAYLILTFGLLGMNFVFNYWLYSSKIRSRKGNKFIYEYLNWDDTSRAARNMGILFFQALFIHVVLWIIFLFKRYYGVALNRRRILGYQVNANVTRMTVTGPNDTYGRSQDYEGGHRSIPKVEFTPHEPEAGPSQKQTSDRSESSRGVSTDEGTVSSGGSYQRIGSPLSNESVGKQTTPVSLSAARPPINEEFKSTETSIKTIFEKIKSLSLAKTLGSSTSLTKHPLDTSAHPPEQNSLQITDTETTKSPPGSIKSLHLSKTSIPYQKPSISSIPAERPSHGSDTHMNDEESTHRVESPQRISPVGSKKSSRQTSHSSKIALPVVPESELDTDNRQVVNDSGEAKAETFPDEETPRTDGEPKAGTSPGKETPRTDGEAKAGTSPGKETPRTDGSAVTDRNRSSSSKSIPPEKKSELSADDHGHERRNENPESHKPIEAPAGSHDNRLPSVQSLKSQPSEQKVTEPQADLPPTNQTDNANSNKVNQGPTTTDQDLR